MEKPKMFINLSVANNKIFKNIKRFHKYYLLILVVLFKKNKTISFHFKNNQIFYIKCNKIIKFMKDSLLLTTLLIFKYLKNLMKIKQKK